MDPIAELVSISRRVLWFRQARKVSGELPIRVGALAIRHQFIDEPLRVGR